MSSSTSSSTPASNPDSSHTGAHADVSPAGQAATNVYIVALREDPYASAQQRSDHLTETERLCRQLPLSPDGSTRYRGIIEADMQPLFHGYIGEFHPDVIAKLKKDAKENLGVVQSVEPSVPVERSGFKANPHPTKNWALEKISAESTFPEYQCIMNEGKGVKIYIVDSGYKHNEEIPNDPERLNFNDTIPATQSGTVPKVTEDVAENFHGTRVAVIAGGSRMGAAPQSTICPLLDCFAGPVKDRPETAAVLISFRRIGLVHKGGDHAVLNCSFSVPAKDTWAFGKALTALIKAGIIVVAAAANRGVEQTTNMLPGGRTDVITVGNFGKDDRVASTSNYGSLVDIYAPGEDIPPPDGLESASGETLTVLSGCSFSAPLVSGVIACILSNTQLTKEESSTSAVKRLLQDAARSITPSTEKDVETVKALYVGNLVGDD